MSIFLYFYFYQTSTKETLTFFPPDPDRSFIEALTQLELKSATNEKGYELAWLSKSMLDQEAYLRQDVSLLYKDGYLIEILSNWKENTDALLQSKNIVGNESGLYEAITFHYAEIHHQNEDIKSAQALTNDWLYVIDSPLEKVHSFKEPQSLAEKENKRTIDYIVNQKQEYELTQLLKTFQLNQEDYVTSSVTDLESTLASIPQLSKEKTTAIMGGLWEGLYREYVHGIRLNNGQVISAQGSTMPTILFPKDISQGELFVVFKTKSGEPIVLKQTF
ncbi:hypothetical protein AB990_12230 [Alkalihalobacillus pseudalcaliphilus]|nr:hypothetical protein AB990_12230 [Alkalihalobacillus pseudalcaliphilus]